MLFFPAHKCYNANNCWHFNIYEQEKFHAQLTTSGPDFDVYADQIPVPVFGSLIWYFNTGLSLEQNTCMKDTKMGVKS